MFATVAKGLHALVRARRRARGPLRPGWRDRYETLALTLPHYAKRTHGLPVALQRRALASRFGRTEVVRTTSFERTRAGDVPAEWFRRGDSDAKRVLLYFHGGGYSLGSVESHRDLIARLCRASGFVALAPDYRLAPGHPFPAQLDDALACYRWLVHERGIDPTRVVVAGESAGGGLTLSLLVKLAEHGEPLPAAAVCISPWVDLEGLGASMDANARYDFIGRGQIESFARHFVQGGDRRHPLAAPLYADLAGLPPLLVQAGGAEVLLDDARRIADRARAAGVSVELEVWDDMIHAWHLFAPLLEESHPAIARIGEFMRQAMR